MYQTTTTTLRVQFLWGFEIFQNQKLYYTGINCCGYNNGKVS